MIIVNNIIPQVANHTILDNGLKKAPRIVNSSFGLRNMKQGL